MNCVIVPTKALADPAELDRALTTSLTEGFAAAAALPNPSVFQVKFINTLWAHKKFLNPPKIVFIDSRRL